MGFVRKQFEKHAPADMGWQGCGPDPLARWDGHDMECHAARRRFERRRIKECAQFDLHPSPENPAEPTIPIAPWMRMSPALSACTSFLRTRFAHFLPTLNNTIYPLQLKQATRNSAEIHPPMLPISERQMTSNESSGILPPLRMPLLGEFSHSRKHGNRMRGT